ncbi:DUF3558 family protein [Corynebacterium aurimucosum]|uniref:DUF3558 family protein n=2 Tax=Corynebacterium aurimucosum TaxID=169292 RepID=UPI0009B6018D|nr:DUF3558 family protein [Corynebacterium aurimucosum]
MKRIGGLVLMAVCIGVLSNCASPLGLGARDHGDNPGDFHNFPGDNTGGGSGDSGVADATATRSREDQASRGEPRAGGGVLPPLGEFDRTVPGFQVFDPCTTETQAVFEDLGLVSTGSVKRQTGYRSCQFEAQDQGGSKASVTVASRDFTISEVRSAFPDGVEATGEEAKSIYLVEESFITNATCTGYMETVQGTISISWTNLSDAISIADNCKNVERLASAAI